MNLKEHHFSTLLFSPWHLCLLLILSVHLSARAQTEPLEVRGVQFSVGSSESPPLLYGKINLKELSVKEVRMTVFWIHDGRNYVAQSVPNRFHTKACYDLDSRNSTEYKNMKNVYLNYASGYFHLPGRYDMAKQRVVSCHYFNPTKNEAVFFNLVYEGEALARVLLFSTDHVDWLMLKALIVQFDLDAAFQESQCLSTIQEALFPNQLMDRP